jgi:hypothetical protein
VPIPAVLAASWRSQPARLAGPDTKPERGARLSSPIRDG